MNTSVLRFPQIFKKLKEDFIQYVWKFQKFDTSRLLTTDGKPLEIIHPGLHNHDSGPDFFNGTVRIGGQQWAGNIEIHLLSSLWYSHGHDTDPAYDNVVLHVVWRHDRVVLRKDNTEVPTVELQHRVPAKAVSNYRRLYSGMHRWIPCESDFAGVDDFVYRNWLDVLFLERMERRSDGYAVVLQSLRNDWEALLFQELCTYFGTKVNKDSFRSIANSIEFSLVRKLAREEGQLEALLLGQAQLLEQIDGDENYEKFRSDYSFLKLKFQLENSAVIPPKFFRLRPANFPTIRLSQLARMYEKRPNLFSEVLEARQPEEYYELFEVSVSAYWQEHFTFGTKHTRKIKSLSRTFMNHLMINVVVPLKFYYLRQLGSGSDEELLWLAGQLPSETNKIISRFEQIGVRTENILQTQALLHLKNEFCDKSLCLRCRIGNEVLRV